MLVRTKKRGYFLKYLGCASVVAPKGEDSNDEMDRKLVLEADELVTFQTATFLLCVVQ